MKREETPAAGDSLETRPGIFVIGSANVGKRTLLSRLLSVEFDDGCESSSELSVNGWKIATKYYSVDVSVWIAHLHEGLDIGAMPMFDRLQALVMVFDISNLKSLTALQEWVSKNDIGNFETSLCIGNKVDRLPGHPVHAEYRRLLLNLEDDSRDYYGELIEGGISETEGASLLGEEEPSFDIKRSCLEWCSMHNIEYIEACASNAEFDKCLSVDGDLQGVERLFGALSAHMWPGMILRSGDKIIEPSLPEKQESSEDERDSDYEFDYEILSTESAEPWEDTEWISASEQGTSSQVEGLVVENVSSQECHEDNGSGQDGKEHQIMKMETHDVSLPTAEDPSERHDLEVGGKTFNFEDLEQLMSEIGNIRDSLRLMPDFQRWEMAANLAMKMASMFGGGSDEEE